jgi:GNAT superfamily N-acetyltransferase
MNDFLRRYARQSHDLGAAKTFLAIDDADQTILGFYSLAPGALAYAGTPAMLRRGLAQHDVPGFRLARIATHVRAQRQGLGGQLLAAAARRCLRAAAEVGGVVLILDAKNKRAARAGGKSASPAIGSNCCRSRRKQLRSAGCGLDSEADQCEVRLRCRTGTVTRFFRLTVRYRQ